MGLNLRQPARTDKLRSKAIELVSKLGQWQNARPIKLLVYNSGSLQIAYRTPFQKLPNPSEATKYKVAQLSGKSNLPYGLDIWFNGTKVFNCEWDAVGPANVISYKPGPWEQELQSNGASPSV